MITKKVSNDLFERLTIPEKKTLINLLHRNKQGYLLLNTEVDVPYYFWSVNRILFDGVDPTEFLDIDDADEFGIHSVYYIARFLLMRRGAKV